MLAIVKILNCDIITIITADLLVSCFEYLFFRIRCQEHRILLRQADPEAVRNILVI